MNFMRFRKIYFLISAAVLVPGILSLIFFGLKPSIDFSGGTLWEILFAEVAVGGQQSGVAGGIEEVFAAQSLEVASVQPSGDDQFIVRTVPLSTEQHEVLVAALRERFGEIEEIKFETLGPTLGREMLLKTLLAIVLAISIILAYVAYRFGDLMFGVTAILAMLHDSLILLGIFSLLGHFASVEVGTLFVTAVLTTLSFSVHDTIVVFDRIREITRSSPVGLEVAIDQAVGETLVRSLNNSLTIIFMLLALFLLGGESLQWFVFALLIGTISGTYSSTFTAAPLLVVWNRLRLRRC